MHDIAIAWPIEPRGYTFLGHAVHRVGAALFSGWTGDEPVDFHLPILEGVSLQEASYNKRGFAKAILRQFDTAEVDDETLVYSEDEWDRAVKLFATHLVPQIKTAINRMSAVMRTMIEGAAQQNLHMVTRSKFGLPLASPPNEWATEWAYSRFSECQMNPAAPFANMQPPSLRGPQLPRGQIDLIPGNEWLFVETASLQAFLAEIASDRAASADKPERLPAIIKGDIKALLRDIIQKWREGGEALELQVGKSQFTELATNKIAGAKPRWATDIWLENRPDEWAKRGPRQQPPSRAAN